MPSVHKRGTANVAGGVLTSMQVSSVKVNGQPICVQGDTGTPDSECDGDVHCSWATVATRGSSSARKVRAGGKLVVVRGDRDTCSHPRASGSPNVNAYEA